MTTEQLLALLNILVGVLCVGGIPFLFSVSTRLTKIETLLSFREEERKRVQQLEDNYLALRDEVLRIKNSL